MSTPQQGATLFSALLILVGLAVVVQLWLVTAAVEALLAHEYQLLVPLAFGSLFLFVVNLVLLRFVYSFDRTID
jgi:hypothetical protein